MSRDGTRVKKYHERQMERNFKSEHKGLCTLEGKSNDILMCLYDVFSFVQPVDSHVFISQIVVLFNCILFHIAFSVFLFFMIYFLRMVFYLFIVLIYYYCYKCIILFFL